MGAQEITADGIVLRYDEHFEHAGENGRAAFILSYRPGFRRQALEALARATLEALVTEDPEPITEPVSPRPFRHEGVGLWAIHDSRHDRPVGMARYLTHESAVEAMTATRRRVEQGGRPDLAASVPFYYVNRVRP